MLFFIQRCYIRMNTVEAASKNEIDMIHTVLNKKYGTLYADIWKIGINLSLRISDLLDLKYADLNLEERSLKLTDGKRRLNFATFTIKERLNFPEANRYYYTCKFMTGKLNAQ
jgi:integrase